MNINDAKYSVLIATEKCIEIFGLLEKGLKIIIFTEVPYNAEAFNDFIDNGFLSIYNNPLGLDFTICDGENVNSNIRLLEELEANDKRFNLAQYLIEHQSVTSNMIIEAGAGTGKTHVMINRMMYLMHMDEGFDFSKVAMITFTNKATDNMRSRLYKTLDIKYKLTGEEKYLDRIEELSKLNICTIHSFFKQILQDVGLILGYGKNVQLKSFIQEKKELLRNILDKRYSGNQRVEDSIGLPIHKIEELALDYWEKLDNNGFSDEDIKRLNWGKASDEKSLKIQQTLMDIFSVVDEQYNEIKFINNAISMRDIIHELGRVINYFDLSHYITTSYNYIFCDEFQDSDNVQIQTIATLIQLFKGKIFVVGDIKQSIYRFRGATDSAFIKLLEHFTEKQKQSLYSESLQKNYRTSKEILDVLDPIFQSWGDMGLQLLKYDDKDRLLPQEEEKGIYRQIKINSKEREQRVLDLIKSIHLNSKYKKVVCLTRKNSQLQQVKKWCEKENIVCLIKERGSFYTSPAVLDFCSMVEAYLYNNEPMYLLNFGLSSYCEEDISYIELAKCNGNAEDLLYNINEKLNIYNWDINNEELKAKPVLSVLRKIVNETNPACIYGKKRKDLLLKKNYPVNLAIEQAIVDMYQYQANLNKLLQILSDSFSGDFASLLDIGEFLRLKILTDREEEQEEISYSGDINYVEGMTVHGSKGLEFENVIIPFMNSPFVQDFRSEIIVSKKKGLIGWVYRDNAIEEKNKNYDVLIDEENEEIAKEETRLLYVAMTRAQYGLFCFPARGPKKEGINCWADLLPEDYDDKECL